MPDRINVALEPLTVRPRVPVPLLIGPLKVPPPVTVRVWVLSCASVTMPAPLSAPMDSLCLTSKVAPRSTVTLSVSAMALPPVTASVPATTWVRPVFVLVPDSVSVRLGPLTVNARAPLPLDRLPLKLPPPVTDKAAARRCR